MENLIRALKEARALISIQVNVYDLDYVLVRSFTSQVAAAEWLSVNQSTVSRYLKSRKVWNNKYTFLKSS